MRKSQKWATGIAITLILSTVILSNPLLIVIINTTTLVFYAIFMECMARK